MYTYVFEALTNFRDVHWLPMATDRFHTFQVSISLDYDDCVNLVACHCFLLCQFVLIGVNMCVPYTIMGVKY